MTWMTFLIVVVATLVGTIGGIAIALLWLERKWKLDLTIPEETPPPVKPAKYTNNKKGKKK